MIRLSQPLPDRDAPGFTGHAEPRLSPQERALIDRRPVAAPAPLRWCPVDRAAFLERLARGVRQ